MNHSFILIRMLVKNFTDDLITLIIYFKSLTLIYITAICFTY